MGDSRIKMKICSCTLAYSVHAFFTLILQIDIPPPPPFAKVPVEHEAKVSRRPRETANISMYGFVCVPADESRRVGEMSVKSGYKI